MGVPVKSESVGSEEGGDGIENMYKIYDSLSSTENKESLEGQFQELLNAVKGTEKEKRLASQFITRFLECFPRLYEDGIEALVDLCEDDNAAIRKQVVKDLVTVCKKIVSFVPKIADVYTQMLQTAEAAELTLVQSCLLSLFHIDAKGALAGIIAQLSSGDQLIMDRAVKFMSSRINELGPEVINQDFERFMLAEISRIIKDLPLTYVNKLFDVLLNTRLVQKVSGQQAVVDMAVDMLDLQKEFDVAEKKSFELLFVCTKFILPLLSSQVSGAPLLQYYCTKVSPQLIECVVIHDTDGPVIKQETLKWMADICFHVKRMELVNTESCIEKIYPILIDYLPLPPEDGAVYEKYNFSYIECLLFVFHKLVSFKPEWMEEETKLKDFRSRLLYFSRAAAGYMKKLREDLEHKKGDELKTNENRIKVNSLKMITSLMAMVKDFFMNPPRYKDQVSLSWHPIVKGAEPEKRKASGWSSPPKFQKTTDSRDRAIYQPPSGKFSGRTGLFHNAGPRFNVGRRGRGSARRFNRY